MQFVPRQLILKDLIFPVAQEDIILFTYLPSTRKTSRQEEELYQAKINCSFTYISDT